MRRPYRPCRRGRSCRSLLIVLAVLSLSSSPVLATLEKEEPFRQEMLHTDKLFHLKTEQKITHSSLIVSLLLQLAEEALQKGDKETATAYAQKAIRFSPPSPLPHFFLSHLYGFNNKEEIVQGLAEYATALRLSFRQFWWLFPFIGIAGVAAFMAVLFTTLTFLLYAFISYCPHWIHYAKERLPQFIRGRSIGFVMALFIVVLFLVFPPFWSMVVSLFLFWFFYTPAEKKAALFCLIGLILLSGAFNLFFVFTSIKHFPLLEEMAKNQQGEFLWFPPPSALPESDWRTSFVRASYQVQEKNLERAESLYKEALSKNTDTAAPILNNLGNIFFYKEDFQEALKYYEKALEVSPNYVTAHYNISQLYNERLAFEEGQKKYLEGKNIDQDRMELYAQMVADYPRYPVVEGRLTGWDLLKGVFTEAIPTKETEKSEGTILWRVFVGHLSLGTFIVLSILLSGGFLMLCRSSSWNISGHFCSVCFEPICSRCERIIANYKACEKCSLNLSAVVAEKNATLPLRIYPLLMIPFGGQLVLQKPLLAFYLSISFYFFGTLMVAGDHFLNSAHGHLSLEGTPLLLAGVLFVYGLSLVDLLLRKRRLSWR